MQIRVTDKFAVELEAPEDLKSFKLVVDAAPDRLDELAQALEGVAQLEGQERAWVRESWIREHSPLVGDPEWQTGVGKMIDYARKFGWVDDAAGTVRAHIEWARTSTS